jgi:hypothetical protein
LIGKLEQSKLRSLAFANQVSLARKSQPFSRGFCVVARVASSRASL